MRQTSAFSSAQETARESAGSSPSHRIAVRSGVRAAWRSTQLAATLSAPSSNHRIDTAPRAKEAFRPRVGATAQSSRRACSSQNPSGSSSERRYASR